MRRIHILLLMLLFIVPSVCSAQDVFSKQHAAELIRLTHQNFWGKAKLSNGAVVQPKDEEERQALPIPHADAVRVVQAAAPAGLGAWCGVDWKSYYHSFMKSERSKPWSEKQIAFIGMLFGVAQGNLMKSMAKSGPCTDKDREGASKFLAKAKSKL